MLYKKYHRSYVSQFKKGTVFKWNETLSAETVRRKPYYDNETIYVADSKYDRWDLVYSDGKINKYLYVV